MLVMSKGALSVGQAETYYQEKYSEDDYYTESDRVTGRPVVWESGRDPWAERASQRGKLSGHLARNETR
jgi:hypothetical protein